MIPATALALAWFAWTPPPGDAYRLPPFHELRAGREANRRYQQHLQWRLLYEEDRSGEMRAALADAVWLYELWDFAEGSHPDYQCGPEVKACYLRRLRLRMGREAYLQATLPNPLPTHHFHALRW